MRQAKWLATSAIALLASHTRAQEAPPAPSGEAAGIEEIVVTAQRRAEPLQDVPIAVSAFTDETLAERRIDDAQDVQFNVPNLILVGNDRPTLRGVGNNAISSTAENGVPVFTNGAYVGGRAENEFFDLERLEILRGPQGTLFGRNTTGGAINLVTRRPGDEYGGEALIETGNFNNVRVKGAANLPIAEGFAQRFAGYYLVRDGYTENLATGSRIDGRRQYGVRSSTALALGEDTDVNLVVQFYKENSSRSRENKRLCRALAVFGCSPTELGFDSPVASATIFQRLLAAVGTPQGIFPRGGDIYAGAPNPTDLRQVAADYDPEFRASELIGTLEIAHSFGDLTLTSLSGYSRSRTEANTDYDNAALPFRFLRPITYRLDRDTVVTTDELRTSDSFRARGRSYTQEFRLASDSDGFFDFTLGLFYLNTRGSASFEIFHPALELAAIAFRLPEESRRFINESPFSKTESYAAFGEGYFQLGERTKLTVGARYTEDEKAIRTRTILLAAPGPFVEAERSYSRITGRVALDHQADLGFTDETLLYASAARGYKAGGLNPGNSNTPEFAPETVNALEIGAKNQFAGRTLQANLAAFYYDYKDLQLAQRVAGTAVTANGDAEVFGLEGEFLWRPSRAFQANTNLSYLDTRIKDFTTVDAANPAQIDPAVGPLTRTPEVPVNLRGNELPFAPKFKVNVGAQYTVGLGASGWTATLRGDYVRQSRYFSREFNTPNDRIAPWAYANALLRLDDPDGTLSFEAFVKNIGNNDNITNSIIEDAQVGQYRNVRVLEPRTYGVALRFAF
ncbi:MAG: TonB-dependent receptor [uncultured Sphingomonadaceae bacterium]|uniref:TonB-dependent receptor n=1 Tax=uncultured Sphingomonadaceae bacterium TaxID=169976 RepID=A0A6J4SG54_9SPHN|nr:MAG: TonB-dependent receptor [uncultured Sphingomonadaceae bacterium]